MSSRMSCSSVDQESIVALPGMLATRSGGLHNPAAISAVASIRPSSPSGTSFREYPLAAPRVPAADCGAGRHGPLPGKASPGEAVQEKPVQEKPAQEKPAAPDSFIPRKQTEPPGPPLSPDEAIEEDDRSRGFLGRARGQRARHRQSGRHDLRRARPVLDHRELRVSPPSSRRPGRDRVKVLEDTDGDGKADKFTVFAEG